MLFSIRGHSRMLTLAFGDFSSWITATDALGILTFNLVYCARLLTLTSPQNLHVMARYSVRLVRLSAMQFPPFVNGRCFPKRSKTYIFLELYPYPNHLCFKSRLKHEHAVLVHVKTWKNDTKQIETSKIWIWKLLHGCPLRTTQSVPLSTNENSRYFLTNCGIMSKLHVIWIQCRAKKASTVSKGVDRLLNEI